MEQFKKAKGKCTSHLLGHRINNKMKDVFQELTDSIGDNEEFDVYGNGDLINNFENEIAKLLGKDQAVFMPSGTMAQQIAIRIWCDQNNNHKVAFHPTCHLEFAEHLGYQYLHNIKRIQFGGPEFIGSRVLTREDFNQLGDLPGVALIELPYRPLGGELPSWETITEIHNWAKENSVYLHLDGARLWETKPFYNKEYSEICSLFDSVYVSFYKGLGGLTGAILAGSKSFIDTARVWQRRYGGNLYSLSPYVLSARLSFEKNIEKIPLFVERAKQIANIISQYSQFRIYPNPPHTNFFNLYVEGSAKELNDKHIELMEKYETSLFPYFSDSNLPGFVKVEMHFFENSLEIGDEKIEKMIKDFLK